MAITVIGGDELKKMVTAAAVNLEQNKAKVDALNVFPVPDGDTGINMSLTMNSAAQEVNNINQPTIEKIAKAVARGALMGARGNSGVILSQIFRGFAKGVDGKNEVDTITFAKAFQEGVNTAYNSVMKPVEGTILTVAREAGNTAVKIARRDREFDSFIKEIIATAEKTLERTPEMLAVLKEAGVVDAGGKGLVYILYGFLYGLSGQDAETYSAKNNVAAVELEAASLEEEISAFGSEDEIKHQYCTELIIKGKELPVNKIREGLNQQGDSLLAVGTDDLVKIHIHTNDPGKVLQLALEFGEIDRIKIENMKEQFRARNYKDGKEAAKIEETEFGIVAVAPGEGLAQVFKSLGVTNVVFGGQTMNPSTEDLAKAVEQTSARNVFILPNNNNIILAATQVKELVQRNVEVIPTKTVPQGITALLAFDGEKSYSENLKNMSNAFKKVKTGEITYAVRDSGYNGHEIKAGDFLGIIEGEIVKSDKDIDQVVFTVIQQMVDDESEIITIFYGEEIQEEDARLLAEKTANSYPDLEIELHYGGQPLYYYIISVE